MVVPALSSVPGHLDITGTLTMNTAFAVLDVNSRSDWTGFTWDGLALGAQGNVTGCSVLFTGSVPAPDLPAFLPGYPDTVTVDSTSSYR